MLLGTQGSQRHRPWERGRRRRFGIIESAPWGLPVFFRADLGCGAPATLARFISRRPSIQLTALFPAEGSLPPTTCGLDHARIKTFESSFFPADKRKKGIDIIAPIEFRIIHLRLSATGCCVAVTAGKGDLKVKKLASTGHSCVQLKHLMHSDSL